MMDAEKPYSISAPVFNNRKILEARFGEVWQASALDTPSFRHTELSGPVCVLESTQNTRERSLS
jgi:hypothetical protein